MSYSLKRKFSLAMVLAFLTVSLAACGGEATPTTGTNPGGVTGTVTGTTTTTGGVTGTVTGTTTTGGVTGTVTGTTTTGGVTGTVTGTTTTSGGTTPGTSAQLPSTCSAVNINYWNDLTGPDGQQMQKMVDAFNSANPNIKVNSNTTQGVSGDYDTQLDTAQASNQLPDVATMNEDKLATRVFRNTLRPMDDMISNLGITQDDYPPVAWNTAKVAGHMYGVPLSFVAMTMYYNNDLLKAAGMTAPPTNKDEFEKAAQAMTTNGHNGFLITTAFPVQQIFQQLLHQFGGSEFSADGTKATWNSDAGVQALTWMKQASDKYGQPNLEVDADLNAFKAGTVGMIWNGIWQLNSVTGQAVSFDGKAAAPPQIGSQPALWAGGKFLSLPAQKNPDPCKDAASGIFIKYLVDNSVTWAQAGNIPMSNKARNSAEFQKMPQAVLSKAVENPVFPPPIPGVADAFGPLGNAIGGIMAGTQTDIKKALDDAATQADSILAENKTRYGDTPGSVPQPTITPNTGGGATPATGGGGGAATPAATDTPGAAGMAETPTAGTAGMAETPTAGSGAMAETPTAAATTAP
jgi:multiple sugar transport system substrate-binding protein